jgi:Co/Zn/Cd efflux system component
LLARFILGLAVFALIVFGVEKIIERFSESQNIELYSFIGYAIVGLWISVAAPWIFVKIRLAGIEQKQ